MSMRRIWAAFPCLVFFATPLTLGYAQPPQQEKPKHTEARATEQKKATEYSEEAFVFEQYATRVRFEDDGTGRQETSVRVKVQSDAGVQQLGELNVGYNSANQKVQIEYVRVRKSDGNVLTAGADAVQDLSAPVTREAPVYTDYRLKHISVPGLRPGETLEYKIVTRTEMPLAPGNFWFEYEFEKNIIVLDEQLEVNVPKARSIKLKTRPGAEPTITEEGDRRIYRWTSKNTQRPTEEELKEKAKKKKPEEEGPAVQLTTFQGWEEVGRWYAGLEKERVAPSPEIRAKADQLIKGRATQLEKIEALYDFVAKNFRYVSLSFGLGRYQPHAAAEVLANQYGDCKDKHTLLAALLEAAGIRAEAALIPSQRKLDAEVPSPSQFDHVITYVPGEKEPVWLDTTTEVAPFRLLSAGLRGKKALAISRNDGAELRETPADPPFPSTQEVEINGEVSELGKLKAQVKYTLRGDAELLLRMAFRRTPQHQWKQIAQWMAMSDGFRGEVTDVKPGDPSATKEAYRIDYEISQANYLNWSSKKSEIALPLPSMGVPNPPDEKEGSEEKIELGTPLDATTRLTLTLPAKYNARAPVSMAMKRDYAEYQASYKLEQNVLRAERTIKFRMRELPAERGGDYRAFLRAIRNDESQSLWVESAVAGTPTIPETAKPEELLQAAGAAFGAQNYALAIDLMKRLLEKEPKHKQAWGLLGSVYLADQQYDKAVEAYNKQTELSPYDENAYNAIGWARWRQQLYEEAAAAFRKQLEVNPLHKGAQTGLGTMLVEWRKFAEAVPVLEKAIALSPDEAGLHLSLGKAQLRLGQKEKALAAFDKAVELSPSPGVWNDVAYYLAEDKLELDRAQQYAESAVSATSAALRNADLDRLTMKEMLQVSSLAAYWDTLGWVYFQRGDLAKAEKYVRASWLLDFHGEVGDHLGQIYEKQGRKQEAIRTYAQAASATRPVPETQGHLAALVGDEKRAEEHRRKEASGPSELRTIRLGKSLKEKARADFLILLAPTGTGESVRAEGVKFLRGSESLRSFDEVLRKAKYEVLFPDDTPTKLVLRGTLTCLPEGSCLFLSLTPDKVTSVQ
jgi:tetratricopeptide (TPR) repeat protein